MEKGKRKKKKDSLPKHRIKQRTKKDPITIETFIGKAQLKITAKSDDWKYLIREFLFNHKGFIQEFDTKVVSMLNHHMQKKPRGNETLKDEASTLYVFFSYWLKKPQKNWPECLTKLIEKVNEDKYVCLYIKDERMKYSALGLTKYCLEKIGRPEEDFDNLYQTYIYADGRLKATRKIYLTDSALKDSLLPYIDPILNRIFKELKLI